MRRRGVQRGQDRHIVYVLVIIEPPRRIWQLLCLGSKMAFCIFCAVIVGEKGEFFIAKRLDAGLLEHIKVFRLDTI